MTIKVRQSSPVRVLVVEVHAEMAALTDKDRANLYKMATAIQADLVKQGYKKGTAEFAKAFERRTKGVMVANRNISETGRVNRARPKPVKGAGKAAAKPTPKPPTPKPAPSASKAPDQPVRARGVSATKKAAIAGGALAAAGAAAAGGRAVYNRNQSAARVAYLRPGASNAAPRTMRNANRGAVTRILRSATGVGGGGGRRLGRLAGGGKNNR